MRCFSIIGSGCQVGECIHCYAHRSSHLLKQGLRNYVVCVFSQCAGIVEGEGEGGGRWPLVQGYATCGGGAE